MSDDPRNVGDPDRYRNLYLKLRGALHDRTTGLPAFPLLVDELRTLLDERRHVGVVHLEAANVDLVESLYGWQVFDRVVARMAHVLRACVGAELPAGTLLAVNGVPADRFVAFVPVGPDGREPEAEWLERAAGKVRSRLEQAFDDDDDVAGLSPRLVFRAGWASLSENPYYRFERRVHQAVEEARSRPGRRIASRDRSWKAELRRIIREEAISVLFQPVVDLKTGEVFGFEALSRGPKDGPFEMPRPMFAFSGRVGAGPELDRACRSAALREAGAVAGGRKLFLNVLPGSLSAPDWRGGVAGLLEAASRRPEDLVLEVSERGLDADPDGVARACEALRALGFGLAVDDVGTGYASLMTIDRVRPDYLKVDASVVRGIQGSLIKQDLLASIVAASRRIGAPVVAVGVETDEEADALRRGGASYGQGYLFADPGPASRWSSPPGGSDA